MEAIVYCTAMYLMGTVFAVLAIRLDNRDCYFA